MSQCRTCRAPLNWLESGGKNVPIDPETGERHECPNQPLTPCRSCSQPTKWGKVEGRRGLVDADGKKHACPVGDTALARPVGHHISASRIEDHETCPRHYRFASILKLGRDESEQMDAGKLAHAAIRQVLGARVHAKDVRSPVTPAELHAALDLVTARERWNAWAITRARTVLESCAARLDFSLAAVDEAGPVAERSVTVPAGQGILIGGAIDLVNLIGDDTGEIRDFKGGDHEVERAGEAVQVGAYLAWAKSVWPEREWFFVHDYIALGYEGRPIPWTQEREDNAKALARALVQKTRLHAGDSDKWPGNFGVPHCERCPFQSRCPEFQARMRETPDVLAPRTPAELAAAIHRFAPLATLATNAVAKWRDALKEHVGRVADTQTFTDDEGKVKTVGKATLGAYPVRITTYTQGAEKTPRAGGLRTRLDVLDPLETLAGALPANPGPPAIQAEATKAGEPIPADAAPPAKRKRKAAITPPKDVGDAGGVPFVPSSTDPVKDALGQLPPGGEGF